jgi:hypothetical protein
MIRNTDRYYLNKEEPAKSCLLALRTIILNQDPNVTETQKYGMPCFCYLWTDKKTDEPYILMVEGKHLHHPKLEAGSRSRMKIFKINPTKNLPIVTVKAILQDALDLYRSGKIKAN